MYNMLKQLPRTVLQGSFKLRNRIKHINLMHQYTIRREQPLQNDLDMIKRTMPIINNNIALYILNNTDVYFDVYDLLALLYQNLLIAAVYSVLYNLSVMP